ncbi:MAG: WG repeat-containing protein [Paludibacteraceae bacterium]|nr:WG repeat-containing protein [Paludibacteraceae bacterium]
MTKKLLTLFALLLLAMSLQAELRAARDKNGKWGFADENSRWAIQPQYDGVDPNNTFTPSRKFAAVKKNGLWGCIDENGQMVTQALLGDNTMAGAAGMEWQTDASSSKGKYEAMDIRTRKWGFVNCRGNWVIKAVFDNVDKSCTFYAGKKYAIVQLKGAWGAIDGNGMLFVKPYMIEVDDARDAAIQNTTFAPLGNKIYTATDPDTHRFGFVNHKGNWVIKPYFLAYDKGYTFAGNRVFAVVKHSSGWGCIDRTGKFIVKPTYGNANAARGAGFAYQQSHPDGVTLADLKDMDDGKNKQSLLMSPTANILGTNTNDGNTAQGNAQSPTLRIIQPKDGSTYTTNNVTVQYEARTFDGSKPQIQTYINGELQSRGKGVQQATQQLTLTLPRNPNTPCHIQMIAKDAHDRNSDPAVVTLQYAGEEGKPALHLLAVGISDYDQPDLKLKNAAKDATDFVNAVRGCNISQYDKIGSATVITDKNATDKNIKKGLSTLINNVGQGDVVMLFFSGHGAKEDGVTYFLSSNAESNDLFSSAVNFEVIKTAVRRLKEKKCRILIFMDACHSGAMYGQKSAAESYTLAEPGAIGFYSSTESQKSNESEKWENGIFTKALIDGLKGQAADADGNITLDGLQRYIRETVRKATNGAQMPIFENQQGNYILFGKRAQP